LVRITVTDQYGFSATDVSDRTFAIDPPANWQIPGSGSGDGTGDGGGGDTSGTPDAPGSSEDKGDIGPLWIAITFEGMAIMALLVMVTRLTLKRREG
jgi:hypothetical protein